MKYIMVVTVLLSMTACAQKNIESIVGYQGLDYESGVNTSMQIQDNEVWMVVRNQFQVDYQVWVFYNYKSKSKNSYVEEMIHEGKEYQRNFIVTIPDDNNDRTRESVTVFVTSSEEYDIDMINDSLDKFLHIWGGTTNGGFVEINGLSIMKRVKYFRTPEIVINSYKSEGSYGNSPKKNFNKGVVK